MPKKCGKIRRVSTVSVGCDKKTQEKEKDLGEISRTNSLKTLDFR